MLQKVFFTFFVSVSTLLLGCQTHLLKEMESLTPGMEKDDVLSKLGSPTTALRMHGKDRWIYVFYDDKIRLEKEIHFFGGNVIYIGEKWEPPYEKQAHVIDTQNEKQQEELQRRVDQERQSNRDSYEEYLRRAHFNDRVRFLPEFTPIQ